MTAPLWSSGFRPFFLLGAAYGPLALFAGLPVWAGWVQSAGAAPPAALWHGHELLYGFASAFICGFVLTALPSWAKAPEVKGAALGVLVVLWLLGRAAAWSYQWLSPGLIGALDLSLFAALAVIVLPGLVHAVERRYLALLPILLAFIAANAVYHAAVAMAAFDLAERALGAALNVLVVLFAIVGGMLTPIFTESTLQQRGRSEPLTVSKALEIAAIGLAVLFAMANWSHLPPTANGAIACLAAIVHAARLCQWRTLSIVSAPLVLAMHLGYAWLVAAMALRGLADVSALVPRTAWVHAFTVGALGMMMLAFLNRVVMRHTGRPVSLSPLSLAGLAIMFAAGLMRIAASLGGEARWLVASTVAWALPFILFLVEHGAKLWQRSLPRDACAGDEPAYRP
ncbi:MAG: NnrS family protein [Pseudorhodoplanes sp.]